MGIFRYPGGKSRLLEPILGALSQFPMESFHDVFVGGGSILVAVAKKYPQVVLHANDLDYRISSFWELVAQGTETECAQFEEMINQPVTIEHFNRLRAEPTSKNMDLAALAYRAVFFNRTTFSGIHMAGPIGGQGQTSKWSVSCRYNAKRLISEFKELRTLMRGRLHVSCRHVVHYLNSKPAIDTYYLDPPYYLKGEELYPVSMEPEEHQMLAETLKSKHRWVMSYDNCPEIRELYEWANQAPLASRYSINGKKKTWSEGEKELLISPKIDSI